MKGSFHVHQGTVFIVSDVVTGDGSRFGSGTGLILNLDCTGSESNVLECSQLPVSSASNCTHISDVGVICGGTSVYTEYCEKASCFLCLGCLNNSVRLVGGSVPNEGRVEVCYNNERRLLLLPTLCSWTQ